MAGKSETNRTVVRTSSGVNMAAWTRLPAHDENFSDLEGMSRRNVLKLMGASAALALGVPGCKRKPKRNIVSRVRGPEYQKPGQALYYASTWTEGNYPYGIIVKAVDGRPIKIEGNPDHPINGESTMAAMQSCLLGLYDPERLQKPLYHGDVVALAEADQHIVAALKQASSVAGGTALCTRVPP